MLSALSPLPSWPTAPPPPAQRSWPAHQRLAGRAVLPGQPSARPRPVIPRNASWTDRFGWRGIGARRLPRCSRSSPYDYVQVTAVVIPPESPRWTLW